jgi:hypothetical protein
VCAGMGGGDGTCSTCGASGQPCCAGSVCMDDGGVCNVATLICP